MGMFDVFSICASGMTSERLRLDLVSNNIANANTTRTSDGGPYKREVPVFAQRLKEARELDGASDHRGAGVEVVQVIEDQNPPRMVHEPNHPDANEEGYVAYPNINIVNEMVDMITASRAYESNVTVFNAAKSMALKALEIGRG